MLQYTFDWKQLSLIAGVTVANFYFRFFDGAIKAPQLVEFLRALGRHIKGKLLVVCDGLPAHRSRLVRRCVESLDGRIVLERLPAYAPALNPVEYLFGYAKQREPANLCLRAIDDVRRYASGQLKAMQRRPRRSPPSGNRLNGRFDVIYLRKARQDYRIEQSRWTRYVRRGRCAVWRAAKRHGLTRGPRAPFAAGVGAAPTTTTRAPPPARRRTSFRGRPRPNPRSPGASARCPAAARRLR